MNLDEAIEAFLEQHRRGERPSVDDYASRYPDLADELRATLPALALMQDFGPESAASGGPILGIDPSLDQIGDYRILAEIGRGGMGIVYEAEQESLARRVALKVLPNRVSRDEESVIRFYREARAAASLHHTNIVPVFEVGRDGDNTFFAMQLIRGQSLDIVIEDLKQLRREKDDGRGQRESMDHTGERIDLSSADRDSENQQSNPIALSLLTNRFHAAGLEEPSDSEHVCLSSKRRGDATTIDNSSTSAVLPGQTTPSSSELDFRQFCRSIARIGQQTADALEYAHGRGIIHRDVKPSNLMLDTSGVVWVTDFGLAKVEDDALTQPGEIIGTVRYIAPERLEGKCDVCADIYSLGLTLYELIVLRPAFQASDRIKMIESIRNETPANPRSIEPRIPRDFETIILKAIDRDPARRYSRAEDMAADLRRFINNEPILARRVSFSEQAWRWSRRNPVVAGLTMTVVVGLFVAVLIVTGLWRRAERARVATDRSRGQLAIALTEAKDARSRSNQSLYASLMSNSWGHYLLGNLADSRISLQQIESDPDLVGLRGWEWFYVHSVCHSELSSFDPVGTTVARDVAFSPDARIVASAHHQRDWRSDPLTSIVLRDVQTGEQLAVFHPNKGRINDLEFSSDGRLLASTGSDGWLRFWTVAPKGDTYQVNESNRIECHLDSDVRLSVDGRFVCYVDRENAVVIRDLQLDRLAFEYLFDDPVTAFDFNMTNRQVAIAGIERREDKSRFVVLVLELDATEPSHQWTAEDRIRSVCWSPRGDRLAIAGERDYFALLDLKGTPKLDTFKPQQENIRDLAFDPTGRRLALAGASGIIRVLDVASMAVDCVLLGHIEAISSVSFDTDGSRLVSSSWDGFVQVWDVTTPPTERHFNIGPGHVDLAIRPGTNTLVGGSRNSCRLIDPVTGDIHRKHVVTARGTFSWPRNDFALSLDGGKFAVPFLADRPVIRIYDTESGELTAELTGLGKGQIAALAWSDDANRLAVAIAEEGDSITSQIDLWDTRTGDLAVVRLPRLDGVSAALALNTDGSQLAVGQQEEAPVRVFNTRTGRLTKELPVVASCKGLAFHPFDDRTLAAADYGNAQLMVCDFRTGDLIYDRLAAPNAVSCVTFSPDGRRIAAIGKEADVRLWDTKSGNALLTLKGAGDPIGTRGWTPRVVFSPDGTQIVANHRGNVVNVWSISRSLTDAVTERRKSYQRRRPIWHLAQATAARRAGDLDSVAFHLKHCEPVTEPGPDYWLMRSWAHDSIGELERALYALTKCIEIAPDDPIAWFTRGKLFRRTEQWAEAVADFDQAKRLFDDPPPELLRLETQCRSALGNRSGVSH